MRFKTLLLPLLAAGVVAGAEARDVETIVYALPDGNSGLRLAWRADSASRWIPLGHDFVRNDFGPWGSHKKMFSPKLFLNGADGRWTAVWDATGKGDAFALTSTEDFAAWTPQRYFAAEVDLPRDMYSVNTLIADSATIDGQRVGGYVQPMPMELIDKLNAYVASRRELAALYGEQAKDDAERFAGLVSPVVTVTPRPGEAKPISDKLIGIFFEDINYGADGGLYAELVQNRDFEYMPSDRSGDVTWNSKTAWSTDGAGRFDIKTDDPIHPNNPHYASLTATTGDFALVNDGYDRIPLKKGDAYKFSMKARSEKNFNVTVSLVGSSGKVLASKKVRINGGNAWGDYKVLLKPSATDDNATLRVSIPAGTSADLDMVSLFPAKTFKGRENGLRADLAQTLADLKPRFVRFPGGCVAHGDGIDNIYDWKGSIGPLEARKPLRNLWGYHQTRGLGYHEYFLFCEDLGAEPLPVLAAGVPCQNSGSAAHHSTCAINTLGQQNGIPMEEMKDYIQDVLDLIEYANGDISTEWGARRAAAGHPEPFNLKYVGIGNEDMITEVFEQRFKMIYDAVREAYPDITVVGTVGPFYEGADYDAGWELARRLDVPMVDEHYYVAPGWLIYNQDYYDKYPRGGTKVYLGEYASHLPGRPSNIETALSDALYLTAVERNGDVVEMTSYAPLLAKKDHTQWTPDLIYFDNTSVNPTVEYQVQKLYGNNSGETYIPSTVTVDNTRRNVVSRIGVSIVKDSATGEYIVKMVNMLPVEVKTVVDLKPLGLNTVSARGQLLTGTPDDKTAVPADVTVSFPEAVLPPYSFTVVRVKCKQ